MLRSHSQRNGRKLIDVAEAIVESHLLLMPSPPEAFAIGERGDGQGARLTAKQP
jgi:hypothetical protein